MKETTIGKLDKKPALKICSNHDFVADWSYFLAVCN